MRAYHPAGQGVFGEWGVIFWKFFFLVAKNVFLGNKLLWKIILGEIIWGIGHS